MSLHKGVGRVSERAEQQRIVQLLRTLGARVYVLGTVRRREDSHFGTMQSLGLPDLLVFDRGQLLMIEVKSKGGRLRPEQQAFRDECFAVGITHLVGGVDIIQAWLEGQGRLKRGA